MFYLFVWLVLGVLGSFPHFVKDENKVKCKFPGILKIAFKRGDMAQPGSNNAVSID